MAGIPSVPDVPGDLRAFMDAVVIPALIERFLREQAAGADGRMAARDSAQLRESVGSAFD
jgi:hypothetical protein